MITIQQFLQYYDPSNHPAVKSNRVTIEQVLQGIIFDMLGEDIYQQYGSYENVLLFTINYEQFEYHYRAVSSVIYSDEYFENIVRSTWKYFHNELPKSRLMLIAKYSSRIDTADFETVLKSNGKKTK